ncbi:PREDICTED: hydroxysteroid dehydrogenase-like protein 2 [Thamnophis sirtalis]|uniref:Hydroxysteroid dehydrogenase-like protein 2 n=1 Tax=Thamnophis sirtalis TaxID=35019 RepID=A0A6I9YAL5_9SAUR|nr:PREDICTED: hydroxysteroid dehydrogenase-like protein 2 [Thamnophis sirtalis]
MDTSLQWCKISANFKSNGKRYFHKGQIISSKFTLANSMRDNLPQNKSYANIKEEVQVGRAPRNHFHPDDGEAPEDPSRAKQVPKRERKDTRPLIRDLELTPCWAAWPGPTKVKAGTAGQISGPGGTGQRLGASQGRSDSCPCLDLEPSSRGIGKAIALKAARDGANVVIAAKTGVPQRTLPGTIYTAAEEIEAAGGKALPCIVNVREEDQIADAVVLAVQKFGGIDVLVNNASAISLTGTLETPTKKVDLMMSANTRGTYLTSKLCLPHLRKSKIGHILNISPPINLNPIWFKNHCGK